MKKKTESNFLRYLKSTKKMTADWPEWKKEALKTRSAEHDVLDDHDALNNTQVTQDRSDCAQWLKNHL
ncbi:MULTISPECIES: hypothetical protein [unclassified Endozoicomonas]|uniref:hypothetical protein n=1 Tax=unclassified Endozoicomonas TaxID=2644528 RepID=UPI003BB5AE3D